MLQSRCLQKYDFRRISYKDLSKNSSTDYYKYPFRIHPCPCVPSKIFPGTTPENFLKDFSLKFSLCNLHGDSKEFLKRLILKLVIGFPQDFLLKSLLGFLQNPWWKFLQGLSHKSMIVFLQTVLKKLLLKYCPFLEESMGFSDSFYEFLKGFLQEFVQLFLQKMRFQKIFFFTKIRK